MHEEVFCILSHKGMQIKMTDSLSHQSEWQSSGKLTVRNAGKVGVGEEPSYTVGGNVK
jgi:hypothetical protein